MPSDAQQIYRREALDQYLAGPSEGKVIRIAPEWTAWSYWLIALVLVAGLCFLSFGTIHEYASGPAVIRIDGREEIVARVRGTVALAPMRPGQPVRKGELLVGFHGASEQAELERVEREQRGLLLESLRDPADRDARQGLTRLEAERHLALARLAQRSVVAPMDGVVTDVRVRVGQAVDAGDVLATLAGTTQRGRLVALAPAQFRPMLAAGMPMRLELAGFRFAYQDLSLETVGEEALGPAEARRFLGPDSADAVAVEGPVVILQARLPALEFSSAGERFQYYDGMIGKAEVRVRTESIASALVPGLREIFGRKSAEPK